MFSTRITHASTMMPRSTAPTDSKFAESPSETRMMTVKNNANGMLAPTMMALRKSPRKIHWIRKTRRHPNRRLCSTVRVVTERSARRQGTVAVDFLDLRFDAIQNLVRLLRPVHNHDTCDHVVLAVATGLAEPGQISDRHLCDILHQYRYPTGLGRERDVFDVLNPLDEAQAADVHRLLPEIDRSAADIEIGVADRGERLLQRDVVGVQPVKIDRDIVSLGGTTPGHDLDYARNR